MKIKNLIKSFNLLSLKPMIYIANVAEEDLMDADSNKFYQDVLAFAKKEGTEVV